MARLNSTPSVTVEMFEDWSDDRLAEFVYDARQWSTTSVVPAILSDAADIAGRLAEAELEERESFRRKIEAAYKAEVNAWYSSQQAHARLH